MSKIQEQIKKLLALKAAKDCRDIQKTADISRYFKKVREYPRGERDENFVACGLEADNDDLEDIFLNILRPLVDDGKIESEDAALDALCKCCMELPPLRRRADFFQCLGEKLGIEIKP